ncbi:hypothetical protein CEXT_336461 [Caerostris extrusa]|uniref:Uncharacterized protein n=1 Tax=Caerostris extrusa TaxID=172846 RepID=A0AAV4UGN4_CAEEX|nr:hypothetical protein CEXT_336461 [Caerostris extrusa]
MSLLEKLHDEFMALSILHRWQEIPKAKFKLIPERVKTRPLYHPWYHRGTNLGIQQITEAHWMCGDRNGDQNEREHQDAMNPSYIASMFKLQKKCDDLGLDCLYVCCF